MLLSNILPPSLPSFPSYSLCLINRSTRLSISILTLLPILSHCCLFLLSFPPHSLFFHLFFQSLYLTFPSSSSPSFFSPVSPSFCCFNRPSFPHSIPPSICSSVHTFLSFSRPSCHANFPSSRFSAIPPALSSFFF